MPNLGDLDFDFKSTTEKAITPSASVFIFILRKLFHPACHGTITTAPMSRFPMNRPNTIGHTRLCLRTGIKPLGTSHQNLASISRPLHRRNPDSDAEGRPNPTRQVPSSAPSISSVEDPEIHTGVSSRAEPCIDLGRSRIRTSRVSRNWSSTRFKSRLRRRPWQGRQALWSINASMGNLRNVVVGLLSTPTAMPCRVRLVCVDIEGLLDHLGELRRPHGQGSGTKQIYRRTIQSMGAAYCL